MSTVLSKSTPGWFKATSKRLDWIQEHTLDYQDKEEGDKAPALEVIDAARGFLRLLNVSDKANFEEPKVFVSPDGELVFAYGDKRKPLNICFTPEVHFCLLLSEKEISGTGADKAIDLVRAHFEV